MRRATFVTSTRGPAPFLGGSWGSGGASGGGAPSTSGSPPQVRSGQTRIRSTSTCTPTRVA